MSQEPVIFFQHVYVVSYMFPTCPCGELYFSDMSIRLPFSKMSMQRVTCFHMPMLIIPRDHLLIGLVGLCVSETCQGDFVVKISLCFCYSLVRT